MKKIFLKENVCVMKSKVLGAGRGVFSSRNINKGDCIELCPAILLSSHDMANLKESMLITYLFYYGKQKEKALIALGFGSLYNHSYKPNAMYVIHDEAQSIEFIAQTDIQKDKEITFDYTSGHQNCETPLWFESRSKRVEATGYI